MRVRNKKSLSKFINKPKMLQSNSLNNKMLIRRRKRKGKTRRKRKVSRMSSKKINNKLMPSLKTDFI